MLFTSDWIEKGASLTFKLETTVVTLALARMPIHSVELRAGRFWWKLFAHDRLCFSNSRVWEPWWQCHVCGARWLLAPFSRANGSLYFSLARLMCLLGFALLGVYPSASSLHTYAVERANSRWGVLARERTGREESSWIQWFACGRLIRL